MNGRRGASATSVLSGELGHPGLRKSQAVCLRTNVGSQTLLYTLFSYLPNGYVATAPRTPHV